MANIPGGRTRADAIAESRRSPAAFAHFDASGTVTQAEEAEAVIDDDGVRVGPVTVSFLDADRLSAQDYRIELRLWPGGSLALTQLGRRFETFSRELRAARNRARVAGLLAHGIVVPESYAGALLERNEWRAAEFLVYDTHVTIITGDDDPWQLPFGAVTAVRTSDDPPAIVLDTAAGATVLGQLARLREACLAAMVERREAQRRFLAELTGQSCFADGQGVARSAIADFTRLLEQFTAPARNACSSTLLAAATAEPRLGYVQLLDPEGERFACAAPLPNHWAVFLLVPAGPLTVLEILAGPSAATYVFRADIDAVNRDLQLMHFRRAPLALTAEQAELTPTNPHRLALRRLEPLRRLRAAMTARVIHNTAWQDGLRAALR